MRHGVAFIDQELKQQRAEHMSTSAKLKARTEEYFALRKMMREYFREELVDPNVRLPKEIKKAIGWRS